MRHRLIFGVMMIALAAVMAAPVQAQLAPYSQDFELLDQMDAGSLTTDGWLVFANVFTPGGGYLYGYGPFDAPNGGPGFSGIDVGMGGPCQGVQQLVVYSDYNNGDHGNGNIIEANVFQEQVVGIEDVGSTWLFEFDYSRGNIAGATTVFAFIKTIDPGAGFALTNFVTADLTASTVMWDNALLSIYIDPSLVGQLLQFGFLSNATNYDGSGMFYDNLSFSALESNCTNSDDEGSDDDESSDGADPSVLGSQAAAGFSDGLLDFTVNINPTTDDSDETHGARVSDRQSVQKGR